MDHCQGDILLVKDVFRLIVPYLSESDLLFTCRHVCKSWCNQLDPFGFLVSSNETSSGITSRSNSQIKDSDEYKDSEEMSLKSIKHLFSFWVPYYHLPIYDYIQKNIESYSVGYKLKHEFYGNTHWIDILQYSMNYLKNKKIFKNDRNDSLAGNRKKSIKNGLVHRMRYKVANLIVKYLEVVRDGFSGFHLNYSGMCNIEELLSIKSWSQLVQMYNNKSTNKSATEYISTVLNEPLIPFLSRCGRRKKRTDTNLKPKGKTNNAIPIQRILPLGKCKERSAFLFQLMILKSKNIDENKKSLRQEQNIVYLEIPTFYSSSFLFDNSDKHGDDHDIVNECIPMFVSSRYNESCNGVVCRFFTDKKYNVLSLSKIRTFCQLKNQKKNDIQAVELVIPSLMYVSKTDIEQKPFSNLSKQYQKKASKKDSKSRDTIFIDSNNFDTSTLNKLINSIFYISENEQPKMNSVERIEFLMLFFKLLYSIKDFVVLVLKFQIKDDVRIISPIVSSDVSSSNSFGGSGELSQNVYSKESNQTFTLYDYYMLKHHTIELCHMKLKEWNPAEIKFSEWLPQDSSVKIKNHESKSILLSLIQEKNNHLYLQYSAKHLTQSISKNIQYNNQEEHLKIIWLTLSSRICLSHLLYKSIFRAVDTKQPRILVLLLNYICTCIDCIFPSSTSKTENRIPNTKYSNLEYTDRSKEFVEYLTDDLKSFFGKGLDNINEENGTRFPNQLSHCSNMDLLSIERYQKSILLCCVQSNNPVLCNGLLEWVDWKYGKEFCKYWIESDLYFALKEDEEGYFSRGGSQYKSVIGIFQSDFGKTYQRLEINRTKTNLPRKNRKLNHEIIEREFNQMKQVAVVLSKYSQVVKEFLEMHLTLRKMRRNVL